MKYSTHAIDDIWSERHIHETWDKLWAIHLQNTPKTEDSFAIEEIIKIRGYLDNIHHEIVRRLIEKILSGESLNLHFGLTSSDITDTTRSILCTESARVIWESIQTLIHTILKIKSTINSKSHTMAFTHLLPAKSIKMTTVYGTWLVLLREIGQPNFAVRGFRGSVGDMHVEHPTETILRRSNHTLQIQNLKLEPEILLQNWSPLSAEGILSYISREVIVLNKIAQDCRYLIILRHMRKKEKDIWASSTLSHKITNPDHFERLVALARRVMSDVACAHQTLLAQGLQRTLDDSAIWREILPNMWGKIHFMVDSLNEEIPKYYLHEIFPFAPEIDSLNAVLKSNNQISRMRADFHARGIL